MSIYGYSNLGETFFNQSFDLFRILSLFLVQASSINSFIDSASILFHDDFLLWFELNNESQSGLYCFYTLGFNPKLSFDEFHSDFNLHFGFTPYKFDLTLFQISILYFFDEGFSDVLNFIGWTIIFDFWFLGTTIRLQGTSPPISLIALRLNRICWIQSAALFKT